MRNNAICFACGTRVDMTDEDSYSMMTTKNFGKPRVICADIECELAFERGPEPQDDTPSIDMSFHDHELMKNEGFPLGMVAGFGVQEVAR